MEFRMHPNSERPPSDYDRYWHPSLPTNLWDAPHWMVHPLVELLSVPAIEQYAYYRPLPPLPKPGEPVPYVRSCSNSAR